MNKILYHPKPGTTGFFLMRNVPNTPSIGKNVITHKKEYRKYQVIMQACKEEAIKNGEIDNPFEVLPIEETLQRIVFWKISNERRKIISDGDVFNLPEGLKFENYCGKCGIAEDDLESDLKICCSTANYKRIRLVPIQEDQDKRNSGGNIIIPKVMTEKNKILSRALTYLSEEDGIGKEIFDELVTLMDNKEEEESQERLNGKFNEGIEAAKQVAENCYNLGIDGKFLLNEIEKLKKPI
jgi:hypothetical protein